MRRESGERGRGVFCSFARSPAALRSPKWKSLLAGYRRSDLETALEILCVELNLAWSSKIAISAIYRPPDSTPSYDFHSIAEFTSHLNNSASLLKSHSLILGDFNYPAIKWIEGCGFSNSTNSADSACRAVSSVLCCF